MTGDLTPPLKEPRAFRIGRAEVMLGHLSGKGDSYLLTGEEVGAIWRVDPKTVHRWALAGKLRYIKTPGGQIRYPLGSTIEKFGTREEWNTFIAERAAYELRALQAGLNKIDNVQVTPQGE